MLASCYIQPASKLAANCGMDLEPATETRSDRSPTFSTENCYSTYVGPLCGAVRLLLKTREGEKLQKLSIDSHAVFLRKKKLKQQLFKFHSRPHQGCEAGL